MIIPPDPEKNPDYFSASSSTPSLVPPPSETSDTANPSHARHRNRAFGYPYSDDLGVGFTGEALPPYARRSTSLEHDRNQNLVDVFADPPRPQSISIPNRRPSSPESESDQSLTPIASTSTSVGIPHLIPSPSTTTAAVASSSKIWEGNSTSTSSATSTSTSRGKRRVLGIPKGFRKWWKRYHKWVYAVLIALLICVGLVIGLMVGLNVGSHKRPPPPSSSSTPWNDYDPDGKKTTIDWSGDSNMNLTYDQSRDGPSPDEGNMTHCNLFTALNSSSDPYNLLSVPFPASNLWVQTFDFPIDCNSTRPSLLSDFLITARGLGSSGTIEFVGTEASETVLEGGAEGMIRVDVVIRYSGAQNLSDMMRVCQMVRGDGAQSVGIYTAQETDSKASNPYMLNPLYMPSIQVVVRFPPSVLSQKSRPLWLPNVQLNVDRSAVRVGYLENVVECGVFGVTSGRGGLVAGYLTAEDVTVLTGSNSIRGTFNVSSSLSLNSTAGTIIAHVILHDATNTSSPGLTVSPSSLMYRDTTTTTTTTQTQQQPLIKTTFYTAEGFVGISYLSQPTTVSLSSLVYTASGDIQVALHPNYVGPFLIKDIWGQVRLSSPKPIPNDDPLDQGRSRTIITGPLQVDDGSLSAEYCLNATMLAMSGKWISGMAYWVDTNTEYDKTTTTTTTTTLVTAQDVQNSLDSQQDQNELVILGAWGDVTLSVDGS
ncbi:hypothetical protein BCR39DRAFT_544074 [Naematelia encephala]|uniref:Transmembrane protein n=1 Tax=Naematelia encephala TaxID=71784 RepID=A0A1Y2ASA8_9TREE|nr:hypothetical protein BCR39DRAFT_544074 [Naematelia encephala]